MFSGHLRDSVSERSKPCIMACDASTIKRSLNDGRLAIVRNDRLKRTCRSRNPVPGLTFNHLPYPIFARLTSNLISSEERVCLA